jgi:hypothetical protein
VSDRAIGLLRPGEMDAGIVGPPPASPGRTRLYLSGPRAGEIAGLFTRSWVDASRDFPPSAPCLDHGRGHDRGCAAGTARGLGARG